MCIFTSAVALHSVSLFKRFVQNKGATIAACGAPELLESLVNTPQPLHVSDPLLALVVVCLYRRCCRRCVPSPFILKSSKVFLHGTLLPGSSSRGMCRPHPHAPTLLLHESACELSCINLTALFKAKHHRHHCFVFHAELGDSFFCFTPSAICGIALW